MITIDFNETYTLARAEIGEQWSVAEFHSPQSAGRAVLLRVIIEPHPDPLLSSVCNLAMGPPIEERGLNDIVRLRHRNSGKVFSTAILFALTFLMEYPEMTIGLDGSDDIRAALYHSMFNVNHAQLSEYFVTIGVDWYVRLLRNQLEIERKDDGSPFFKPRPEAFDHGRTRLDLYRYYMFKLK